MCSLAGNRVSDDVIRVKWLDLLPPTASRLLTLFKAPNLDELARAADELVDSDPSVMAAGYPSQQASTPALTPSRDPLAGEPAALRQTLSQLIVLTRENLEHSRRNGDHPHPSRSQSRSPGHQRGRSSSANAGAPSSICWYHRRHGSAAQHCTQPCTHNSTAAGSTQLQSGNF